MYGVVVCPRCRKAKAVDLRDKTERCQCGNLIKLTESRRFFESTDQREVASAVARLNAEIEGGVEEWEKAIDQAEPVANDPLSRIVADALTTTDVQERLEIVARGLTVAFGNFTIDDLQRVLRMLGMRGVEDCVQVLLRENVIYEPQPGVYRAV